MKQLERVTHKNRGDIMTTLEKIKSKVTRIDIDELIERLKVELKIPVEIIENKEKSKFKC